MRKGGWRTRTWLEPEHGRHLAHVHEPCRRHAEAQTLPWFAAVCPRVREPAETIIKCETGIECPGPRATARAGRGDDGISRHVQRNVIMSNERDVITCRCAHGMSNESKKGLSNDHD